MSRAADPRQLTLPLQAPSYDADPVTTDRDLDQHRGGLRRLLLGGELCQFRLRRARRRTIGFQIDDMGLTVSAPAWMSLRAIEEAILEKERWIRQKLAEWRDRRAQAASQPQRWGDGASLRYLGNELTLRLRVGASPVAAVSHLGPELVIALPPGAGEREARAAVQDWLRREAAAMIGERIELLAGRAVVKPFTWRLSSARTQWGSCNEDGRVNLNWRLIFFPVAVIDYVVAHELAHLTELNHGPRFWREVERLLPGFRAGRDLIKDEELTALPL
ncbi:MAG: M48 family metallopeptidase [Burkholderiaceae bacterium]|nr:M48 family metallopeptidase [Burkholderiaceae bacterium]